MKFIPEHKIVIVGDGGVGKTCLTTMFIQQHFVDEYDPTLEDSCRRQIVLDGEAVLLDVLDVLDTAGQEEYAAMREQYLRMGEGCILAYSITTRDSLAYLRQLYEQIVHVKKTKHLAILLVGCKCDLEDMRQVSKTEAQDFADELKCKLVETSSLKSTNVDVAFEEMARLIRTFKKEIKEAEAEDSEKSKQQERPMRSGSMKKKKKKKKKKKASACCTVL